MKTKHEVDVMAKMEVLMHYLILIKLRGANMNFLATSEF
jgi:hypothetical protein